MSAKALQNQQQVQQKNMKDMQYYATDAPIMYTEHFDTDSLAYTCCFTNCHIKTGAAILAICEVVYVIIRMCIIFLVQVQLAKAQIIEVCIMSAWLLVVIVMLYGLFAENEKYLMPYLFVQVVVILMMFIGALLCFIVLVTGSDKIEEFIGQSAMENNADMKNCEKRTQFVAITFVVALFAGQILVWFFVIVLGAYRYLCDKNIAARKALLQQAPANAFYGAAATMPPMQMPVGRR